MEDNLKYLNNYLNEYQTEELLNIMGCIINNTRNLNISPQDFNLIFNANEKSKSLFESLFLFNAKSQKYSEKINQEYSYLQKLLSTQKNEEESPINVSFNFSTKLHKYFILDFSLIELYYIENNEMKKYNKQKNHNNEIFIYSVELIQNIVSLKEIIDTLISSKGKENIFNIINNEINIIFQINSKEKITEILNNNPEMKELLDIPNIHILFYIKQENNQNMFKTNYIYGKNYFFVLNKENQIIKIKPLKKLKSYINKLKNKIDEEKINASIKLLEFLSKIIDNKYWFDIKFDLNCIVNLINNDIMIIKNIKINKLIGTFQTKEYNILKNLCEIIKPKQFELKEHKTIDIDIDFTNNICSKCKNNIPDNSDMYYCYKCKKKYCTICVDNQLKKEGKEKFIDQKHNLLYFNTRNKNNLKNIDIWKLGKNSFAEVKNNNEFHNQHQIRCDGCNGDCENMARYVCLTCYKGKEEKTNMVDYCEECIIHLRKNDEEAKNIENENMYEVYNDDPNLGFLDSVQDYREKHDHKTHIYLMIPLEIEGSGYFGY